MMMMRVALSLPLLSPSVSPVIALCRYDDERNRKIIKKAHSVKNKKRERDECFTYKLLVRTRTSRERERER